MEERRPTSSRNATTMENARRFLYDEDEPPIEYPVAVQLGTHTNLSNADKDRRNNRLSPIMASCLGVFAGIWNRIQHTPRGRLLGFGGCIVGALLLILMFTSRGGGGGGGGGGRGSRGMEKVKEKILQAGLSNQHLLATGSSPQHKALRWLALEDKTSEDDPFLLQRYALAVIYYSTAGSGWESKTNWMSTKGYCSWYGIECAFKGSNFEGNDEITTLSLPENHLKGPLPSEIQSLSNLITLELTGNNLTSTLPTELLSMPNLNYILLRKNQLRGTLPDDYWYGVGGLRELDLGHNELDGTLPPMLFGQSNLRKLGLEYNKLNGQISPDAVTGLTRICK